MVLFSVVGELGCHSEDTKIFSPDGIKTFEEINVGDNVFAIDNNENIIETKVKDKILGDYDGKLYRIKSKRYNFLVTPNHRMLFKKKNILKTEYIEARDLKGKGYIPVSFKTEGKRTSTFYIYNYIEKDIFKNGRNIKSENLNSFYILDFVKLMGWYISEGSIFKPNGKSTLYVQLRNYNHKEEIKELLDKMKLNYGVYENGSKFVIFHKDLGRYFNERCGRYSKNKKIPKEITELSPYIQIRLLDTLFKGDGSTNQTYYTISKRLSHDVMKLCLRCGYNPRLTVRKSQNGGKTKGRQIIGSKDCQEVHVSFMPKGYFSTYSDSGSNGISNISLEKYKGKVWCLETEHGNFFTYLDGNVQVSGNSGKTLTAVSLCYKNWYVRKRKVFSNIHLYRIPYYHIKGINQINQCKDGFILADELWSICDARSSITKKNKIVSDILLRSRKRELIYAITTQDPSQLDKRIRRILDFTSYGLLSRNESVLKLNIFRTGYPKPGTFMSTMYFYTKEIFDMYDTNEEMDMEEEVDEPMEIRFQPNFNREHGNFCECEECGGQIFETWKEADKAGSDYWKKKFESDPTIKIF